jgi:hypothetical protein
MKEQFQKNFPFISCLRYGDKEYIGIIINWDSSVVSVYDLFMISDQEKKQHFLSMGETWWWESNRKIPINIFLKNEMKIFRSYIKTFNSKDAELIFGPTVNLDEIAEKRIKRKSIQLVRSPKNIRS